MNDVSAFLFGVSYGGAICLCAWLYWIIKFDVYNLITQSSSNKKVEGGNE